MLEFSPTRLLDAGKTQTVLLSTALRSTTGEALGGLTTFSFRTAGGSGGPPVLPPASALRRTAGDLHVGRRNHTATRLANGHVLLCGGYAQGTFVTDRAEDFDPSSETFTQLTAHMRQPRAGHTATRLADGRVLLAGGWYEVSSGTLNVAQTAEIFDPATGQFSDVGNLGIPRADHAALRLPDGRVLVTGGSLLAGDQLIDHASAEAFDPSLGTWSPWAHAMTHTRSTHGMVDLLDGRWLLAGGSDVDLRPDLFDTTTGLFTPVAAAAADHARFGASMARFSSGNVSVSGGESAGDVLLFDRTFDVLLNSGSPTTLPRAYGTATTIAPDRVLLAGGINFANGSFVLSSCDLVVEGGPSGSSTYATAVRFPTGHGRPHRDAPRRRPRALRRRPQRDGRAARAVRRVRLHAVARGPGGARAARDALCRRAPPTSRAWDSPGPAGRPRGRAPGSTGVITGLDVRKLLRFRNSSAKQVSIDWPPIQQPGSSCSSRRNSAPSSYQSFFPMKRKWPRIPMRSRP